MHLRPHHLMTYDLATYDLSACPLLFVHVRVALSETLIVLQHPIMCARSYHELGEVADLAILQMDPQ